MFGWKARARAMTAPAHDELTITLYDLKGGYSARCPFGGQCQESPGRGLPFVTQGRSKVLVVAAMNDHLDAVHGIDGAVPRRIEN